MKEEGNEVGSGAPPTQASQKGQVDRGVGGDNKFSVVFTDCEIHEC